MTGSDTAADTTVATDHSDFFNPPGGILLWIVILLELLTFGIAIIVMMHSATAEPTVFHDSALQLNRVLGTVNTVVLLTSGYCMALCVQYFKQGATRKSKVLLAATLLLGLLFLVFKSIEYGHKIAEGLTLGASTFFDFYWLLTGFHLVHVVTGMVILLWWQATHRRSAHAAAADNLEAGAAFWHLCDLIWLLLFPVLYLIF